jgi:hypothetical protein
MGGLAYPQDFLLDLRHPFVAAFNRQVAARDQDSRRGTAHHGQYQQGEIVECLARFDLEQDADIGAGTPRLGASSTFVTAPRSGFSR